MGKRGLRLVSNWALSALLLASVASAAGPEEVEIGWRGFLTGGAISPKALPKEEPGPAALGLEGKWVGVTDPPTLSELQLELDRFITLDVEGLPVCRADAVCRDAVLGHGSAEIELTAPTGTPEFVNGTLTVTTVAKEAKSSPFTFAATLTLRSAGPWSAR